MNIDPEIINYEGTTKNNQILKDLILDALVSEGYMSMDKALDFQKKYAIIMVKPSWFEIIFTYFFPKYIKTSYYYRVVKFVGTEINNKLNSEATGKNPVRSEVQNITDIEVLRSMLKEAEESNNFEKAAEIRDRIKVLGFDK